MDSATATAECSAAFHTALAEVEICPICKKGDSEDAYGPRMMLLCSCCMLRGVHLECEEQRTGCSLPESAVSDSSTLWFCSLPCQHVYENLEQVVLKLPATDGRKLEVVDTSVPTRTAKRAREAGLKILQGAFSNMKMENGRDLIEMVVGAYVTPDAEHEAGAPAFDFGAFRTFVLREGTTYVCAATVRIFGTVFAEIPFIGTKESHRNQGAMRSLLTQLECVLAELGVRQLVLASIKKLKSMWQRKFGFKLLTVQEAAKLEDICISPEPDTCAMMRKPLGKQAELESSWRETAQSAEYSIRSVLAGASNPQTAQGARGQKRKAAAMASDLIAKQRHCGHVGDRQPSASTSDYSGTDTPESGSEEGSPAGAAVRGNEDGTLCGPANAHQHSQQMQGCTAEQQAPHQMTVHLTGDEAQRSVCSMLLLYRLLGTHVHLALLNAMETQLQGLAGPGAKPCRPKLEGAHGSLREAMNAHPYNSSDICRLQPQVAQASAALKGLWDAVEQVSVPKDLQRQVSRLCTGLSQVEAAMLELSASAATCGLRP